MLLVVVRTEETFDGRTKKTITKCRQYWLDHINAVEASVYILIASAAANKLKVKDLDHWMTALAYRGFLSVKKTEAVFAEEATAM